jgi:hypothetical protein
MTAVFLNFLKLWKILEVNIHNFILEAILQKCCNQLEFFSFVGGGYSYSTES